MTANVAALIADCEARQMPANDTSAVRVGDNIRIFHAFPVIRAGIIDRPMWFKVDAVNGGNVSVSFTRTDGRKMTCWFDFGRFNVQSRPVPMAGYDHVLTSRDGNWVPVSDYQKNFLAVANSHQR